MRVLQIALGIAAASALLLKLFTYEFYLRDDPTAGIALRSTPGFSNHAVLQEVRGRKDVVVVQSENDYLGGGLYRLTVGWGWIVLLGAWVTVAVVESRASKRP
ncbi:MAG TPA: hypothetical protein VM120_27700 [Bryobacteraceae bacterium]|nr:hypothetical protein [Bryobacteraceae bacterium]